MEGHWTNYFNGDEVNTSIAIANGKLYGDPTRNCGAFIPAWGGWVDWICQIPRAHFISCACQHPGQMYLQLRGLCSDSNIDRVFIPKNKKKSGAVQLLGLDTTLIEYDKMDMAWKLTEHSQNTIAVTDASLASFALGTHEWLIENDNVECSNKGKPYTRVLKLTGCKDGEFTCRDGQCIRNLKALIILYKHGHVNIRN